MLRQIYGAAAVIATAAAQKTELPKADAYIAALPKVPYVATLNTAVNYETYKKQIVTYTVHEPDFTIDIWYQRLDDNRVTMAEMEAQSNETGSEVYIMQGFALTNDMALEGKNMNDLS